MTSRVLRACVVISLLAAASPGRTGLNAQASRAPGMPCQALRASTGFELSIDTATVVGPRGDTPEFCQVMGMVAPEVRFELALPKAWNGRLYMFGNGGFAGESLTSGARAQRRDPALAKGFAVVSTNTGHDAAREPLASFALNPQKLADYAYRAVHVTALSAKSLIKTYYGAPPDRSYFEGCSTGGRQALISAQRFPDDFDGIIAGAPVLDFTGTMLHYVQVNRAMRAAPGLAGKMEAIAGRIYAGCDAVDGVSDGQIEDPRACRFDPEAELTRCPAGAGGSDCVTAEEIAALQAVYRPLMAGNAPRFPGFPVGAEASAPAGGAPRSGWDPWIVSGQGQQTISNRFMETFFKYMVTPGREIDWAAADHAKLIDQVKPLGAMLDATDTDLTRFRGRGGKLLMYFGWADPALNPMMGVNYYERVREAMGPGTPEFFRLFMMPGVFHCSGGVGPDRADTLGAVMAWVEGGTAPDRLVARKMQEEKAVRTRPLCPYPQVARYQGSGSIDDEGNFSCAAPR